MTRDTPPEDQPPPSPHAPPSAGPSDRIAWICMAVIVVMGAGMLVWATSLTAG
jgi:hypothetical protein